MRKGILIVALLFRPGGSWAHVFPVRSDPRVGATVTTAPTEVVLFFDAGLEPDSSSITVRNADKIQVDNKDSHITGKDADELVVSLRPALSAGEYHVEWTAVAQDGHLTMGHFSFWIIGRRSFEPAEPKSQRR